MWVFLGAAVYILAAMRHAPIWLAVALLAGVTIGMIFDAGGLERFLEPIVVYLFAEDGAGASGLSLMEVDFDPFDPCLWGATSPHDLCI